MSGVIGEGWDSIAQTNGSGDGYSSNTVGKNHPNLGHLAKPDPVVVIADQLRRRLKGELPADSVTAWWSFEKIFDSRWALYVAANPEHPECERVLRYLEAFPDVHEGYNVYIAEWPTLETGD